MQRTALFWCQLLGHYPAKYRVMVPAIPGPYLGLAGQCRHGFPHRTCLLRGGSVGALGVPAAKQRCDIPLILAARQKWGVHCVPALEQSDTLGRRRALGQGLVHLLPDSKGAVQHT